MSSPDYMLEVYSTFTFILNVCIIREVGRLAAAAGQWHDGDWWWWGTVREEAFINSECH